MGSARLISEAQSKEMWSAQTIVPIADPPAGAAGPDEAVQKAAAKRNANSRPSLAAANYAGRYRDAWYGDVTIEEHGGKLTISFIQLRTGWLPARQADSKSAAD